MAETNPLKNPKLDEAIDAALDAATRRGPAATSEVPLKRQWDEELEAELEAALSGFDAAAFDVRTPRTRAEDRKHVPSKARGQEAAPGPRQGKVIAARGKSVFIDLGAKSEGVVPIEQFQGNIPMAGEMIDVIVDRFDTEEGLLILSLKGAAVEARWDNVHKGMIVEARVLKTNKGGLEVDVNGLRGFLPVGQIDYNRVEDPAVYLNEKLRVVVTEANPRERNLVVSRRELIEQERAEQREKTWASLEEGQVRHGIVRSVKDYGAFVDLGGVDGLLHVGEMSWARISDPSGLLKVGQEVDVKVLKIDRENKKLSLGLKQLTPSPWDLVEDKYERGMTVKGKVTRLMDFGAFVELEPGVEGLIHVSELSPTRVRKIADVVQPGQEIEVRVLKVEPDAKRISLSLLPLAGTEAEEEDDEEEDETPQPPKPERKIPLKGGLGDRDPEWLPKR